MWLLRAVKIFQKATESSQGQKISKGNCGVFDSPIKQTIENNGGGIKK